MSFTHSTLILIPLKLQDIIPHILMQSRLHQEILKHLRPQCLCLASSRTKVVDLSPGKFMTHDTQCHLPRNHQLLAKCDISISVSRTQTWKAAGETLPLVFPASSIHPRGWLSSWEMLGSNTLLTSRDRSTVGNKNSEQNGHLCFQCPTFSLGLCPDKGIDP
jgi:hypothetical protein